MWHLVRIFTETDDKLCKYLNPYMFAQNMGQMRTKEQKIMSLVIFFYLGHHLWTSVIFADFTWFMVSIESSEGPDKSLVPMKQLQNTCTLMDGLPDPCKDPDMINILYTPGCSFSISASEQSLGWQTLTLCCSALLHSALWYEIGCSNSTAANKPRSLEVLNIVQCSIYA